MPKYSRVNNDDIHTFNTCQDKGPYFTFLYMYYKYLTFDIQTIFWAIQTEVVQVEKHISIIPIMHYIPICPKNNNVFTVRL